jgi:hypothetical protein
VEQSQISVFSEVKKSVYIHCKIWSTNFENEVIHWYWQKQNQALEHLVHVASTKSPAKSSVRGSVVGGSSKVEAIKDPQSFSSTLIINFIEKEDEAIYYCAGWDPQYLTC